MKPKLYIFGPLFLPCVLFCLSCNSPTQPPPPGNGLLTLSLTDVSCTEAWIELKTNGVALPVNVNLLANNSIITQLNNLRSSDTTIYIDSLLPNKSYQLQAQISQSISITSSNKITVQTLDTTSNNFTWQTYSFGDFSIGSSVLYDVAVIDDNNIWAVGDIYADDSTGHPDPQPYNVIHWNGSKWEIRKLYYTFNGQNFIGPIYAIFVFNANDIWFGMGSMIHWDGNQFESVPNSAAFQSIVNKIWGTSSTDLFIIGNSGNIAHYNGNSWQKINTGINLNAYDVWGDYNIKNSNYEIYAVASDIGNGFEKKIIRLTSNNADSVSSPVEQASLRGIWFKAGVQYYIVGDGIFEKQDISGSGNWKEISKGVTNNYIEAIRGNDLNDLFMCGDYGEFLHFNGETWHSFQNSMNGAQLLSISVKGNTIVAVGQNFPYAFIAVGKR